jgi:hypothetical protein
MTANKNVRGCIEIACESLLIIQDMLMDSARITAKLDEATAWQDAETLFRLAKEADVLRKRLVGLLSDNPPKPVTEAPELRGESHRPSRATAHAGEASPKKKKSDYPKYLISDNCLVKIGLQRDRRTEYQHIVQKAAFEKTASVIASHLAKDKEFTPESIQAELNLPSYQTYVVLAMLRHMGLLKIPRRGLYTATGTQDFGSSASAVWSRLSTERGARE